MGTRRGYGIEVEKLWASLRWLLHEGHSKEDVVSEELVDEQEVSDDLS